MADCLFCDMVQGKVPADKLYDDDLVFAIRDINPRAPRHFMVIPKEHIAGIDAIEDLHADMLADVFQAASHLAKADGVHESGWRVVSNVGPDAGQSVFHLHFHVLGGRSMAWPPG